MNKKSKIHLIRHSITEGNKKRWYYGKIDIPLLEEGIEEVRRLVKEDIYPCRRELAEYLSKESTNNIRNGERVEKTFEKTSSIAGITDEKTFGIKFYTSGMQRAEQTFRLIYGEIEREILDGFRELSFGIFEGYSHDELNGREDYQLWIDNYGSAAPGGESHIEFANRISETFKYLCDKLSSEEELSQIVVVCHGGVIGGLMMGLFPQENKHLYKWIPDPAHGYTLELEDDKVVNYQPF